MAISNIKENLFNVISQPKIVMDPLLIFDLGSKLSDIEE